MASTSSHYAEYGVARTLHAAGGQAEKLVFVLYGSVLARHMPEKNYEGMIYGATRCTDGCKIWSQEG